MGTREKDPQKTKLIIANDLKLLLFDYILCSLLLTFSVYYAKQELGKAVNSPDIQLFGKAKHNNFDFHSMQMLFASVFMQTLEMS